MTQCIAKTLNGKQCKHTGKYGIGKMVVCGHHKNLIKNTGYEKNKSKEQSGGSGIPLLPSCLDILSCNWTKNLSYVLPGLNYLLNI